MTEAVTENPGTQAETHAFDAEVHQLLKLMINALYSNREIFLRELISNASDAIDKLRFIALTDAELQASVQPPSIDLSFDAEAGKLVIEDTGIGMTRDEVVENLGTIARSGTARFLESLSGDQQKDAQLIGQFGVGFYSSFIVAEQVTVETLKAGQSADTAVRWQSRGEGEYTLETIERAGHGTRIVLKLSEPHRDLLDAQRLRSIIEHYSNHVAFPIRLEQMVAATEDAEETTELEQINDTQALWTRPKAEIGEQEYQEFYGGLTGDFEPPAIWAHHHVEGTQSYSMLLYLPSRAPFDLAWNRDERSGLKLYINRVFIMDAAESLVPRYLRFVRGVIDSADLPLNVSREILQDSPLLSKIRSAVVRRSLDMLEKLASQGGEVWDTVRDEFGNVLKEGIIEDPANRERIASLLRFESTQIHDEARTSLADYLQRAQASSNESDEDGTDKPKQTIWYLLADSRARALS
ncbi:MAG: molecular chaperone HtpG, partial [Pseudomonadota bacterium]